MYVLYIFLNYPTYLHTPLDRSTLFLIFALYFSLSAQYIILNSCFLYVLYFFLCVNLHTLPVTLLPFAPDFPHCGTINCISILFYHEKKVEE